MSSIVRTSATEEIVAVLDLANEFEPRIQREIAKRIMRQADAAEQPTHVIFGNVRSLYLRGCKGRIGRTRDSKVEFFPQPGSAAYQRNREWAVSMRCLKELEA
jgi:hypothetical protein